MASVFWLETKKSSLVSSVTRLGEIFVFGRIFLSLGAFFLKSIAQNSPM
jgi:hypothetical protein